MLYFLRVASDSGCRSYARPNAAGTGCQNELWGAVELNHRQRTSIFRKFLWSYTAFVVLSAMTIGGISYFFSVNDYNREIENVNKALLTQYKNVVQSDVIDRSVTLALNVSSGVGMERSTDTLFHAKSVLLSDALALYKELAYAVSQIRLSLTASTFTTRKSS